MNKANHFNPFSQEYLDRIFQLDTRHPNRIVSRESGSLEFKENFNFASLPRYARTMAAFSNSEGGYLVFGIGDQPRELLGMQSNQFERLEPERFTSELNNLFVPEIRWDTYTHTIDSKQFGIIYTHDCSAKPVIAKTTFDQGEDIRESEIYYRYRARNERIRYPELYAIIEQRQTSNLQKWLEFIQRVAKIGVENAAIIDLLEGTLSGPGGTLIISEELLEQIKFIREGQFTDIGGDPTLRVIGDVESISSNLVQPIRLVDKRVGINMPDIIHAFLGQEKVNSPREYIKQMCFEASGYLPIYYFMRLAKLSESDTTTFLRNQQSRMQSRDKLVGRLSADNAGDKVSPSTTHPSSIKTREFHKQLLDQTIDPDMDVSEIRYALRAVRMLEQDDIQPDYLFPILQTWFDNYYADRTANLAGELRRAVCYVDFVLFHQEGSITS